MPRIPQFVSSRDPRFVRQPLQDMETAMVPGKALAQLGQQVTGVGLLLLQKHVDLRNFNDEHQRVTDATLAIDAVVRESEGDPNFREHTQRVTAKTSKIVTGALKGTRGESAAKIKARLDLEQEKALINARDYEQGRERDFGREELLRDSLEDLKRAGEATGLDRETILLGARDRLDRAVDLNLIKPEERERLIQEGAVKLERGRFLKNRRIDAQATLQDLIDGHYDFDAGAREGYIAETQNIVTQQDREKRTLENEARQAEERAQGVLAETLKQRTAAGEDVSAELTVANLGGQYSETFNAVRAITSARAQGNLVASNPRTFMGFRARLVGVGNPLTEREVVGAFDAGMLNGADMIALAAGIEDRKKTDPWTPEQKLALGNAEQIIRDRLRLKVPGIDKWTETDGERQTLATNNAIIEFFDLEKKARQTKQPFDALRVAQEVAQKWRDSPIMSEGVTNEKGVLTIFGVSVFEDAQLEIGRRVRAGRLDAETARLLLRTAASMPRKAAPEAAKPGKRVIPLMPLVPLIR